jgi:hypothetical protein
VAVVPATSSVYCEAVRWVNEISVRDQKILLHCHYHSQMHCEMGLLAADSPGNSKTLGQKMCAKGEPRPVAAAAGCLMAAQAVVRVVVEP